MSKIKILLCLIIFLQIFISGCYTYYKISEENLFKQKDHNKARIILNNGDVLNLDLNKLVLREDKLIILQDSMQSIDFKDIRKIEEQKFDGIKTMFTVFWVLLGTLAAIILIYHPKVG